MEKALLRSESERTMRNLRVLNQEMHTTIKELRLRTSEAQGRVALSERLEKEAVTSHEEADCARRLAESQEKEVREERNKLQSLNIRLQEEIKHLQDKLTDVQNRLTLKERSYFESKSKLDHSTRENQLKLEEIRNLECERDRERLRTKELLEEVSKLKDREAVLRQAAVAAEEASDEASRLQYETERYRKLAEHEREEKRQECELWQQKHDFLSNILRSQEEQKAKRKNKGCQAKFQTYFLCRTECDQRVSVAKAHDGNPKSFMLPGEDKHQHVKGKMRSELFQCKIL
ncbi:trichohyalin isoform X2 [Heterodontus francisci]|uniref:trichohyalin isoform X2 n=1 Tax=Heterodontus francisci TaxID=7792 RepID=UPI00355ADF9D